MAKPLDKATVNYYLIKCLRFFWKFPCIPQDLLHISLYNDKKKKKVNA